MPQEYPGADAPARMEEKRDRPSKAASGAPAFVSERRRARRFHVPGAYVVCEQRAIFGFRAKPGPRCAVFDLGVRGLSFANIGERLKPGARVWITLHVSGQPLAELKAELIWTQDAVAGCAQLCGVQFGHYPGELGQMISDACEKHGRSPTSRDEPVPRAGRAE